MSNIKICNRPRLDEEQIIELKSDIKMINSLIKKRISLIKSSKYATTSSQNAIARELGFDSFSELSILSVNEKHHENFRIDNSLSIMQFFNAYKNLSLKDNNAKILSISDVSIALDEFKSFKNSKKEKVITLKELHKIINSSEYCGHKYTKDNEFPDEFNIDPNDDFFNNLKNGDQFKVKTENEYKYFTVSSFEHIYSKKYIFKVIVGKWYNLDSSPFCTGNQ